MSEVLAWIALSLVVFGGVVYVDGLFNDRF
jgi:hypothetical protein